MRALFLLFTLTSLSSDASLDSLISGLNNTSVQKKFKSQAKVQSLSDEKLNLPYVWMFGANFQLQDEKSVGFFSFQTQRTLSKSLNLNLSKNYNSGLGFKYDLDLIDFDLSNWDSATLLGVASGKDPTQINSTFSLSQNLSTYFWGHSDQLQREQNRLDREITKITQSTQAQSQVYQVIKSYLQVKSLQKQKLNINKVLSEELRRIRLLKRRFKDGLILEDSLLMAQANRESFKLDKTRSDYQILQLKKNLEIITERQIDIKNLDERRSNLIIPKISMSDSSEIKLLKKNLERLSLEIDKSKLALKPQIDLRLSYQSSALSGSLGRSINDGLIGSEFNNKSIGLNFSKRFDHKVQNSFIEQVKANKKIGEFDIQKKEKLYRSWIDYFNTEVKMKKQEVSTLKKRHFLLAKAQKKREKLFASGQKEIDDIIDIVNLKSNIKNKTLQKELEIELQVLEVLFITGNVNSFTQYYREEK